MRHANLSIFVPHLGCPHQCSFCNQRSISGAQSLPTGETVAVLCQEAGEALRGRCAPGEAEIAFFGGSFTAIGRGYMLELLEAAQPALGAGLFGGIRVSTRPDRVDREILGLLSRYHVTAIELGAQSMCDRVLQKNGRGHTADDVRHAAGLISEAGFELGLQLMTGLDGSDEAADFESALSAASLKPRTMRVYPTVVVEGTGLARRWRAGEYRPQTLKQAVSAGARLLDLFEGRGIRVIRMGLHAQESLQDGLLAGPYHPAFRELCEGELLFQKLAAALGAFPAGDYTVYVAPKAVSKITGHGGRTVEKLRELGYNSKIKQDARLDGLTFRIGEV